MRIAQIAPVAVRVPPRNYGGIERVVALLVDSLVDRGHDVTLFASGDSQTKATVASVMDAAPGLNDPHLFDHELVHETFAFLRAGEFDVVHDHSWFGTSLGSLVSSSVPVVKTLHLPWDEDSRRFHTLVGDRIQRVAVSEHQRRSGPPLPCAVIHHGIDLDRHPFRDQKDDYLLFLGRIVREKGPELAVQVAKRANRHLKMLIKCEEPHEHEHWERAVVPVLTGDEEVIEGVGETAKVQYLSRAAGVLFPVRWAEPFGLVMIEAMACGTPVISLSAGAAPEVIVDGVTGFLVSSVDEMVEAVDRLRRISPAACRERVMGAFTKERMAGSYETLFRSVLRRSAARRLK